eukprot:108515_1
MSITFVAFSTIIVYNVVKTGSQHIHWVTHGDNTMPRGDTMMSIGTVNNTIYLLGGFYERQQMTQYDCETGSFIYFRSSFLPNTTKCFGDAQFWTQLDTNLYILDDTDIHNTKISLYNMLTNEFVSDYESIPNRVTVSDGMGRACLASIDNSIYVNGGITEILVNEPSLPIATTYILNINTMEWGLAPSMQIGRRSHSCIIHPNNKVLYSFGGDIIDGMTDTIERISTINIHDNIWIYLNETLSNAVRGLRSFIFGDNLIIIIGGLDESRKVYDYIHIIDTNDDSVILSDITLSFQSAFSAATMVGNIMYSFGGGSFGVDDNIQWQSMVNDIAHTHAPNISQTNFPSQNVSISISTSAGLNISNLSSTIVWEEEGLTIRDQAAIGFGIVCFFICIGMVIYIWNVYYRKNEKNEEFEKINDEENKLPNQPKNMDNEDANSVDKHLNGYVEDNEEKIDMPISSGLESDSY